MEVPDELHLAIRQLQLDIEMDGERKKLRELYCDLIAKGLEYIQQKGKTYETPKR